MHAWRKGGRERDGGVPNHLKASEHGVWHGLGQTADPVEVRSMLVYRLVIQNLFFPRVIHPYICKPLSNAGTYPPLESAGTVRQEPTPKVPWSTAMNRLDSLSSSSPSHPHSPPMSTGCLDSPSSRTVTHGQAEWWWLYSEPRTRPAPRTWSSGGWMRRTS